MKFSTVRDPFYAITGDSPSNPVYFSVPMVLAYGTTAIARACAMTDCAEGRQDLFVTAGVGEYALADDCRRVYRVTFGGDRIVPDLKYKLRMLMDNWDQLTGLPSRYYLDGLNKQIGFWRKPSASTVDGSVVYDGSYPFGDLSATSDPTDTANQSLGGVVAVSGDAFTVGSDSAEIFYVAEPPPLVDAESDMGLPMWAAPYVLFSMLSQAYGSDTQLKNPGLSGFWASAADSVLIRLKQRTGDRRLTMTGNGFKSGRLPKGLFVTYPTPITE